VNFVKIGCMTKVPNYCFRIGGADRWIDRIVHEFYGLTEEEIKIA